MANTFTKLTNTVLAQTALEAFLDTMTPIRAFATNFSADAVQRGDKVKVCFVNAASAAADFSGSYSMQAASAEGLDITINKRKYVSWSLTPEELATQPQLNLERFARQKGNALAKAVLQDIWSQITAANYGNTDHTGPGVGGDKVTIAVANFDSDEIALTMNCCDEEKWPDTERALILGPGYYYGIMKDSDVVGTAGLDASSVLRTGKVPQVFGFNLYKSNCIPANSENLAGFAANPDGMLVAMRALIPEAGISGRPMVTPFTDPESGMTIVMREWFDPDNDASKRVLECNYGYRVGNATGVKRLVTA